MNPFISLILVVVRFQQSPRKAYFAIIAKIKTKIKTELIPKIAHSKGVYFCYYAYFVIIIHNLSIKIQEIIFHYKLYFLISGDYVIENGD